MTIQDYFYSLYLPTKTDAEYEAVEALENSLYDMTKEELQSWMIANSIDFTSPTGMREIEAMGL